LKDLAPLSSLTGLQRLSYRLGNKAAQDQHVDHSDGQFLGNLASLKVLGGDLMLKADMLEHISRCTALEGLYLRTAKRVVRPSSSDWQVLGQLTHLTRLNIVSDMLPPDGDVQLYYSALQRLTGLQQLTTGRLTAAVVPTLAALTKLTLLSGAWTAEGQGRDGDATCEQVVRLIEASGLVPFRVFPNVEVVGLAGPLDTASWEALGSCCPKVKEVVVNSLLTPRSAWPSFPPGALGTARVAAIKGLAQLPRLTQLNFIVSHELEVLALADAVKHVEVLKLWLCPTAGLDWACLLPLGKLTIVKSVHCCVCVPPPSKHVVQMLLSGLAHARSVTLTVSAADVAVVQEAVDESRAMGLGLPEKAVVLS
jgi:hypothetical protein